MLKNARLTSYLLSDTAVICPESENSGADDPARPATPVLYAPERKPRRIGAVRKRLLDSIVGYLYRRSQRAANAEERDSFTLALAIMSAVRRLEPKPFESACYQAFGSSLKVYLKRRAECQWHQHQELVRCIPDYDSQADKRLNPAQAENRLEETAHADVVEAGEIRRIEARPGRVHQMPSKAQPSIEKPLREVPPRPAAKDA